MDHEHEQNPHRHGDDHKHNMEHQHTVWQLQEFKGDICGGAVKGWGNGEIMSRGGREWTGDRNQKYVEPSLANIEKYRGFTGKTGQKENTVKNIAVQCYIAAKVMV